MEISTSVLVITNRPQEIAQIKRSFASRQIAVHSLVTMFDSYVADYLNQHNTTAAYSHVLLDLDMGYQPAIDILRLLKTHSSTTQIPVLVYSLYQSSSIVQYLERNGADLYFVKSAGWPSLVKTFSRLYRTNKSLSSAHYLNSRKSDWAA
ncbi:hypothetical protein GCM10023187_16200 [Nibrella viscosa]|uniref:Response regulatory domain-containing protein n=1 Tax=Nibrella viscosa TaxID=1084524 RepID=A0ABP8K7V2_9BACT